MNTKYALHAVFEKPVVKLEDICEEYFGITYRTAMIKVNSGEFPVPTFRQEDSQRSPILIHVDDLADYIDKRLSEARKEWNSVRGAA